MTVAGLPQDRPLLRAANALSFEAKDSASATGRLSDVHVGLLPSGTEGGSVHLVSGSYDYHHYMQATPPALLLEAPALKIRFLLQALHPKCNGRVAMHQVYTYDN